LAFYFHISELVLKTHTHTHSQTSIYRHARCTTTSCGEQTVAFVRVWLCIYVCVRARARIIFPVSWLTFHNNFIGIFSQNWSSFNYPENPQCIVNAEWL